MRVVRALLSESGFIGLKDFQDSPGERVCDRRALVGTRNGGILVMEKSARCAKRNPENPTNPVNPDSDKDAQSPLNPLGSPNPTLRPRRPAYVPIVALSIIA